MYALADYARMLADTQRMNAYSMALKKSIRLGDVVVDVGTGTGVLAVVACLCGARRVYAIDVNDVIRLGPEIAAANGCADRIEFIQGDAMTVSLPERAHVVVSDLRGGLPFAPHNLAVMARAREELLLPDGVMIPARDDVWVAVVGSRARWMLALGPETSNGVTLDAMRTHLANTMHRDRQRLLQPRDLLAKGLPWSVVNAMDVQPTKTVRGTVQWQLGGGVGFGLALWFDTTLVDGVGFSTAPGQACVYPQMFLPWKEPIEFLPGETLRVDLWCGSEGEFWGWNATVAGNDGVVRVKRKQSNLIGSLKSPSFLHSG